MPKSCCSTACNLSSSPRTSELGLDGRKGRVGKGEGECRFLGGKEERDVGGDPGKINKGKGREWKKGMSGEDGIALSFD